MNNLYSVATIVAGLFGIMMTTVSWRVLKGNPVLDNPVIHVVVGVLTFVSLRYHPGGMIGMILLGYEAVAISILFLLLWMGFQTVRQSRLYRELSNKLDKQICRAHETKPHLTETRGKDSKR